MGQSPGAASVEVRPEHRPAAGEGVSPCPQRGLVVQWEDSGCVTSCNPEHKCGGGGSGVGFGVKQANGSDVSVMRAEASGQSWGLRAHWERVGHGGQGMGGARGQRH